MSLVDGAIGTASAVAELTGPGKGSAGITELAGGEAYGFGGRSLWGTPEGCWTSVGRGGSYFPGTRLKVRLGAGRGRAWMRRGPRVKGRSLRHSSGPGRGPGSAQAGVLPWEAVCLGPHAAPHLVLITG